MAKYHVEKDGWRVELWMGGCRWVEANPTYSKICSKCSGSGYISDSNCEHARNGDYMGFGCDCQVKCPSCKLIHGKGMVKDEPKHPMPSMDIIFKLEEELSRTMKKFGFRLSTGLVEYEIKEEKKFNASMKGANL